jgi:hypothetical protein
MIAIPDKRRRIPYGKIAFYSTLAAFILALVLAYVLTRPIEYTMSGVSCTPGENTQCYAVTYRARQEGWLTRWIEERRGK